ncbi:unnamed protein product, partial [Ectocarpus sp. 12 AP-2014]
AAVAVLPVAQKSQRTPLPSLRSASPGAATGTLLPPRQVASSCASADSDRIVVVPSRCGSIRARRALASSRALLRTGVAASRRPGRCCCRCCESEGSEAESDSLETTTTTSPRSV